MIYEKLSDKKILGLHWLMLFSIVLLIMLFFTLLLVFSPSTFKSDFKLDDLIQAIGQFSTAGALFFGIYQFGRAKKRERQTLLGTEAKSLAARIKEESKNIKTGDESSIENIKDVLATIASIGSDFDQVYGAMHEDIEKAIARMHWQDMFFNFLTPRLKDISLDPVILSIVEPELYLECKSYAYRKADEKNILNAYKKNYIYEYMLEYPGLKPHNEELTDLGEKLSYMSLFVAVFFDKNKYNDHLTGVFNRPDIRVLAPAIAALRKLFAPHLLGKEKTGEA